ncbi:MAG: hypothetical protein PF445_11675 [Melioribacteraceae bacterium]|jgi:hypothetical protein|nr:hypothetical protein [Melioribacteraceae bacterium]
MNIKGLIIPDDNFSNTINATKFALRYFNDLHQETKEFSIEEGFEDGDTVIISLPYVGNTIASGYESTIKSLYNDKDVIWIVFLIKDDLLEKGSVLIDDFINKLQEGKEVYLDYFTKMTSKREIPLQTAEMMQIMDVCNKFYKKYK